MSTFMFKRAAGTACVLTGAALLVATPALEAAEGGSSGRRIEEVVVTAEKRESTVQDTAISITAFDEKFIQQFGLRNQEDLQNYIPATQIQPYDVTIRGVGRLFRTLGGDPGVSTYLNGVYSEDFGIASTEGGLYDVERVEVLRGPQGTLYGRNGVGGAVNFINNSPRDEFGGEARILSGNYELVEYYYTLNAPLIEDLLAARFVGSKRTRSGYINDTSPFESSINNYGDENYSLSLRLTPADNLSFTVRGNERSYRRKFNGGAGTSPIVTSQNGGNTRTTDVLAFGYHVLSSNGVATGEADNPNMPNVTFNHRGITRVAERVRPGVNPNGPFTFASDPDGAGPMLPTARDNTSANAILPNYAFGLPSNSRLLSQPKDSSNLSGDDLEVATHGQYDEFFDHQAVAFNATWDVSDNLTLKYIAGYTDFFYDRNTDEDKTANTLLGSYDFYVLQENENWQHELQILFSFDNLTITNGLFIYDSFIDQRLDLYDPIDTQGRLQANVNYLGAGAALAPLLGGSGQRLDIESAKRAYEAGAPLGADGTVALLDLWFGDTGDSLRSGLNTPGTFFAWDNTTHTRAKAAYSQAEWQFADQWALTLGARYAKDDKRGKERLLTQLELSGFNGAFDAACPVGVTGLRCYNTLTGALNAAGDPTGAVPVRFNGLPFTFNSFLPLNDSWDQITWRVNLDYDINDDHLMYLSATTGWRSGGFNLGFRSTNAPIFDEEEVLSYELGYKGQLFDNTLQVNASVYLYQYDNIQQIVSVVTQLGVGTAVTNAPQARTIGFEGDLLWYPTDNLTLGGNWSYTNAKFTDTYLTIDTTNPAAPGTVYSPQERTFDADGNRLTNIPEYKFVVYGNYSWPMAERGKIDLLTTVSWTDEFFFSYDNSDFDKAPDVWRWDASVSWTSADERWIARGFVNNITDELGIREYQAFGDLTGDFMRAGTTNDPRAYGVELRWKFGGL